MNEKEKFLDFSSFIGWVNPNNTEEIAYSAKYVVIDIPDLVGGKVDFIGLIPNFNYFVGDLI